MGHFYETFPPSLVQWLLEQKVFYIASAPLSGDGHVNVSPKGVSDKGGPFFGVIKEPNPGSISNTNSVDDDNEKADKNVVIRKFGTPHEYGTATFNALVASEGINIIPGTRSIVLVDIHQVGTSCGFSMPYYDFVGFRQTLNEFFEKRIKSEKEGNRKDGIEVYWAFKNAWSMDGLPGMRRAVKTGITDSVKPIKKMVGRYAPKNGQRRRPTQMFTLGHLLLAALVGALISAGLFLLLLRLDSVALSLGKSVRGGGGKGFYSPWSNWSSSDVLNAVRPKEGLSI